MAVTSCRLEREFGRASLSYRYSDEQVTEKFIIEMDAESRNWPSILTECQALGGSNNAPPGRGALWPTNTNYGLYAKKFDWEVDAGKTTKLHLTVTYLPLEPGEEDPSADNDNPLLWPTQYDLQYIEEEFVVQEAKNIQGFTGTNFNRSPGTLGPVTNSAGDETEEPLVDIERIAVLTITRNVETLNDIVAQEYDFHRTTNSDGVSLLGADPRTLKFLGVQSGGKQNANGIIYFPRITSVGIYKSTDVKLNNVGWNEIIDGKKQKIKVNGEDPSDPKFLDMAGKKINTAQSVTYRYLDEVPYTNMINGF